MTTLIEAFTEELQLWLGDTTAITPFDITNMLVAAQTKMIQTVKPVDIKIEGDPQDVARVTQTLKQMLQVNEKKAEHAQLTEGRIRRELTIAGLELAPEEPMARPGNLDPQHLAAHPSKPSPSQKTPSTPEDDALYGALKTLARGLLEFPTDGDGRRKFGGAYPALFKEGVSQLNAYFLTKGVIISDSYEYWRMMGKPLKEWPVIPAHLQSPDPLIDHEGRTTLLTEHLAR